MTPNEERRLGAEPEASQEAAAAAESTAIADAGATDTRPRCARCGRTLTAPRSVARNHGPECWRRIDVGRLDQRRDAVGRKLAASARLVARLDLDGLDILSDMLTSVLDTLGGEL